MEVQKRLQNSNKGRFYPEFALIGKFARNFYANPETTLDIGFIANLDERLAEFIEYISSSFRRRMWATGSTKGIRVDLVKPPGYKFNEEVISKRKIMKIEGIGIVPVLSPEDLFMWYHR